MATEREADSLDARTAPTALPNALRWQHSMLPLKWTPCETEGPIGGDHVIAGAQLIDATGRSLFTEDCGDYQGLSDDIAARIVHAVNAHFGLVDALRMFGHHLQDCGKWEWVTGIDAIVDRRVLGAKDCTCGLFAAIAKAAQ